MASGVFDLLHPGHVIYLSEAKRAGGKNARLVVVVARDSTVRKVRNRGPVFNEEARRILVESLKPVDKAILGSEPFSFEEIVRKVKPDVVAFGYDQERWMGDFLKTKKRMKWKVKAARIKEFKSSPIHSSSAAVEKILKQDAWRKASG
ncbi:MAG: FAD synthase [Aigarchaeota archaeon]|nr:FAD synthase [Aigarchaeota archaeon]